MTARCSGREGFTWHDCLIMGIRNGRMEVDGLSVHFCWPLSANGCLTIYTIRLDSNAVPHTRMSRPSF